MITGMVQTRIVGDSPRVLLGYADPLCASALSISVESFRRMANTPSTCFVSSGRRLRNVQTASVHSWLGTDCLDVLLQHSCSYRLDTGRIGPGALPQKPSNDMFFESYNSDCLC